MTQKSPTRRRSGLSPDWAYQIFSLYRFLMFIAYLFSNFYRLSVF